MKTSDLLKGVVTLDEYLAERLSEEKPITNADRIRSMTDEELAEELWSWNQTCCYKWQKDKILGWLKQKAADKDGAE